MKKDSIRIPIDRNGNQLHYPSCDYISYDQALAEGLISAEDCASLKSARPWGSHVVSCKFVDNYVFQDTLRIEGMERGRSAAYFCLTSTTTGTKFTMFMKDALELAQMTMIDHGLVSGTWTFVKRGQNYGVRRLLS